MDLSDQEAVQKALANPQSFSILVERYQRPLAAYLRRLGVSDAEHAKDILQESFIKAYVNLNDYDSSFSFSSWIYRITHNETMAHFRRQKNRPRAIIKEDALTLFETIPDELDIAAESDAKMRGVQVAHALAKLRREYRDVIILRFYEAKSYDEISDILRIPPGTVATYVARGKAALKKLLAEGHITGV